MTLPLKKTGMLYTLVRMALLILAGAVFIMGNMPAIRAESAAGTTVSQSISIQNDMEMLYEAFTPPAQTVPDGFAFSGGTGKMQMLCPRVYSAGGRTCVLLCLSSAKAPQVTYEGKVYPVADQRVFLPIPVNETVTISVLTTAMSTPHEVDYKVCVYVKEDLSRGWRNGPTAGISAQGLKTAAAMEDFAEEERTRVDPVGRQNLASKDPWKLVLKNGMLRTQDTDGPGGTANTENSDSSKEYGSSERSESAKDAKKAEDAANGTYEIPQIDGLAIDSEIDFTYAQELHIYRCQDGLRLIDIPKSARYLYVPEGTHAPEGLLGDITILEGPVDSVYLAATGAMALIDAIGATDRVSMSGTSEGTWLIDAPKEALANGSMVYAGKYSEPDFETMIARGCDLAVESTMILHTPKVKEMVEDLGIPVLIDYSSYETSPLGRTEWVKLYGTLLGKESEAEAFFEEQKKIVESLENAEPTEKTVAYFWITQQGTVVIRTRNDYIPGMIDLAGGNYIFDGAIDYPDSGSTMTISMEQFYAAASDADLLVYNATIDDALRDTADLIAKNAVFSEFKAVKEGNVWQIDKKAYQSTDKAAELITDFRNMLTGETGNYTFLTHLS